jgi:hypothetical protein
MRYGVAFWYLAFICAALFLVVIAYAVIDGWAARKRRRDGERAVERMRKLERHEPPEPEPALKPELTLQVAAEAQTARSVVPAQEPEPAAEPELTLQVAATAQPVRSLAPAPEPEPAVGPQLPLPAGTKVRAVRNFGPVKEGAPGIITGAADIGFLWWSRPAYRCTFAGNMKVHARPKDIEAFEHGHGLAELQQADFESVLSRQMALRAQQLLSRQRPTRSRVAGGAAVLSGVGERR